MQIYLRLEMSQFVGSWREGTTGRLSHMNEMCFILNKEQYVNKLIKLLLWIRVMLERVLLPKP